MSGDDPTRKEEEEQKDPSHEVKSTWLPGKDGETGAGPEDKKTWGVYTPDESTPQTTPEAPPQTTPEAPPQTTQTGGEDPYSTKRLDSSETQKLPLLTEDGTPPKSTAGPQAQTAEASQQQTTPTKWALPKSNTVIGGTVYQASNSGSAWGTTKVTGDEATYASAGFYNLQLSALEAYYNATEQKAALNLVKGEGQFSCAHGEWDIWDGIKGLLGWKTPPPPAPPAPGSPGTGGPFAARLTDITTHTPPLSPGPGSPNVLIANLPAWRTVVDSHVCLSCGGVVLVGAPTVLINNQMACRVGDVVAEPCAPNPIAIGCPTVMIGIMGPAPSVSTAIPADKPWIDLILKGTGDAGEVKGEGIIGGELDWGDKSGMVGVKGGVLAAILRGDVTVGVQVKIPYLDYYGVVGVKGEGMVGAVGAEGGGFIVINKKDATTGKVVTAHGEYGGKVGAGWLGGGLTTFFTVMPAQ